MTDTAEHVQQQRPDGEHTAAAITSDQALDSTSAVNLAVKAESQQAATDEPVKQETEAAATSSLDQPDDVDPDSNSATLTTATVIGKRKASDELNTHATNGSASKKPKIKWARKQLTEAEAAKYHNSQQQQGGDYNIWYDKYQVTRREDRYVREKAETRCHPERDSGRTKADDDAAYFCIKFAQGRCTYGAGCHFLHRIPNDDDAARIDMSHDVFGRERFQNDRDDMGGVGSVFRDNRTIFVSHIFTADLVENNGRKAQASLQRHFGAFGELEQVNVKPKHMCAFVKYKHRVNAEFAKIAMSDQSLDHNEQINVRWAYDDPNPRTKAIGRRQDLEKVYNAIDAVEQRQMTAVQQPAPQLNGASDAATDGEQYQYAGNGYYWDTVNQVYLYWNADTQQYVQYLAPAEQQPQPAPSVTAIGPAMPPATAADSDVAAYEKHAHTNGTEQQPEEHANNSTSSEPTVNVSEAAVIDEYADVPSQQAADAMSAFDDLLDKIDARKSG